MNWKHVVGLSAVLLIQAEKTATAQMRITEWQYNGSEFVEFTNIGGSGIDMNGWSFDDNTRLAGSLSLSAFGIVNAGESVILSEENAAGFRTRWSLSASVDVIGGNSQNLGRADEINLYDNSSIPLLIDRLTYDDQTIAGSIRTDVKSGNPNTLADLGTNNVLNWKFSALGDEFGSYNSTATPTAYTANPGFYPTTSVPEPSSLMLLVIGAAVALLRFHRK